MKLTLKNQKNFHLDYSSPWPLITAFSALMLTFGGVLYMQGYVGGSSLLQLGLCMVLFMMFVWWRDVIREGTFEGQHTFIVQKGLRTGVSSPYLILCQMFMLARVQIGLYVLFYLTVLLQLLSAYNLSLVLFVLWCAFLLAYTLELNIGYCDKAFLNVVRDATLSAFIFLGSAFWYIQAWKAKVIHLKQQIYHLLSKLQASLEAKIALINANESAYNNSIAVKTAIIVLLLTSIALFAYWWLGGGGDDSGGGGGGNIDIVSTSTESINSLTSIDVASISTILQSATVFDKLVNSAIESSSDIVKHCIDKSRTLGKVKGYFNAFDSILKDLELDLDTVLGEIKKTPSDFMNEETCTSLKCAVTGLFEIQREFQNYNPGSALNIHEKNELESLAQQLLNLLETQSDFSATCDNALPNLTSAVAFYYILTESKGLILALKISMDGLTELLKRCTNYSNIARKLVNMYIKAVESFRKDFEFWSDTNIDVNYTYAAKFVERFRDMCKNIILIK